jgi:hypothetical protein
VRTLTFANANHGWSTHDQKTKAASGIPDAALANLIVDSLEGEIYAGADHPEIVLRSVDEIPAEIANPANMRRHANFHATADLADCPRFGTSLFGANDSVVHDDVCLFTSTKDSATSTKNVGRETRTGNRVA